MHERCDHRRWWRCRQGDRPWAARRGCVQACARLQPAARPRPAAQLLRASWVGIHPPPGFLPLPAARPLRQVCQCCSGEPGRAARCAADATACRHATCSAMDVTARRQRQTRTRAHPLALWVQPPSPGGPRPACSPARSSGWLESRPQASPRRGRWGHSLPAPSHRFARRPPSCMQATPATHQVRAAQSARPHSPGRLCDSAPSAASQPCTGAAGSPQEAACACAACPAGPTWTHSRGMATRGMLWSLPDPS